jgi:hypothetical protein
LNALRNHLLQGHQCVESWLALSRLVATVAQRKDCLERAAVLVPEDQDIQMAYLETCLKLEPNNLSLQRRLQQLQVLSTLKNSDSRVFDRREDPRPIGDILVEQGLATREMISAALSRQRTHGGIMTPRLGNMLLEGGYITPQSLARALIVQQQERSRMRVAPQAFGEFLVERGHLTAQQLEQALTEQIELDQRGQRLMLGELLVKLRYLKREKLASALQAYEASFWDRFYDR